MSEATQETEVAESWRIRTLNDADWALKRLGELEREVAENEAIAAKRIEDVRIRTALLNEKAMKGIAFFSTILAAYAEQHRDELLKSGKKKTRNLPSGSIGWRSKSESLVVNDKEALLEWARTQPIESGVIRIKEEPAIDAVKRLYATTGEVPPGCDVEPAREELLLKPAKEMSDGD